MAKILTIFGLLGLDGCPLGHQHVTPACCAQAGRQDHDIDLSANVFACYETPNGGDDKRGIQSYTQEEGNQQYNPLAQGDAESASDCSENSCDCHGQAPNIDRPLSSRRPDTDHSLHHRSLTVDIWQEVYDG